MYLKIPDDCITEIACGIYEATKLTGKYGVQLELPSKYRVLVIPDNGEKVEGFVKLRTNQEVGINDTKKSHRKWLNQWSYRWIGWISSYLFHFKIGGNCSNYYANDCRNSIGYYGESKIIVYPFSIFLHCFR